VLGSKSKEPRPSNGKLWTTPKFLNASGIQQPPFQCTRSGPLQSRERDFLASTSFSGRRVGERILTRVGHYRVTSTLCDGMTTRAVSTNRLQRLVQGDFTEPSAVLMR
jgi:hypothetical protein